MPQQPKKASLLPIKAKGKIIQKACDKCRQITQEHLYLALLPERITLSNNKVVIMPEEYAEQVK